MAEHNHHPFHSIDAELAVLQVILARRARTRIFDQRLFFDPGWDLLLCLFLARLRQQKMTLEQLGQDIALSPNVVSRWVDTLDQHDLVRLKSDSTDRRHMKVELTKKGADSMRQWLDACRNNEVGCEDRVIELLSRIRP